MKHYLAIDIGASSGRHIVGWREDGKIKTDEVYRFPNGVKEENGHLVWNVEDLLSNVVTGIDAALQAYPAIESLSIDTWGVDYVLLKEDQEIYPVYAYRDSRTETVIPQVHKAIPFAQLYQRTGCQFQPFNSIYQLYHIAKNKYRMENAKELLFVPSYIAPSLKKMYIGKPIRFCHDAPIKEERRRICDYLMKEITDIACGLPEHTVVPYRNIPKKLYPSNIPSEVPVHEKTERTVDGTRFYQRAFTDAMKKT